MSWFRKNNKIEIQRKLERILNKTISLTSHVPIGSEEDERGDDRAERLTPVVVLEVTEADTAPQITTGLTRDISVEGLGVTTLGSLAPEHSYAIGIGSGNEFAVLECRCVRSDAIGYGYFANGLAVTDLLSEVDFVSLKEFAEYLGNHPPASALPVAPTAHA